MTVRSKAASAERGDVTIQVRHGATTGSRPITVKTPWYLEHQSDSHVPDAEWGFHSTILYKACDQFHVDLPRAIEWHEDFPNGWVRDDPNSNWTFPAAQGGGPFPAGALPDQIYGQGAGNNIPPVLSPQNPLSDHAVISAEQHWYLGSADNGGTAGVHMQSDTCRKYEDHGMNDNRQPDHIHQP